MNSSKKDLIMLFGSVTFIFAIVAGSFAWLLWIRGYVIGIFVLLIITKFLLASIVVMILKIIFYKKELYYIQKYLAIIIGNTLILLLFFPLHLSSELPTILNPLFTNIPYSQTIFKFYFDGNNIKYVHDPFNKLVFFFGDPPDSDEVKDGTRTIKIKSKGTILASWVDMIRLRSENSTIGGVFGISISTKDIWIENSGQVKIDRSML
jgi:hypothetical protein